MLLYRIIPYSATAEAGAPGSPTFVPQQGYGRWDSPGTFTLWYFGESPTAAVGEVFASHAAWTDDMLTFPALPGARRALMTYRLDESLSVLDLDDAQVLLDRGMRPTQVVIRNRGYTQQQAERFYREVRADGQQRWAGIRWWSIHRPQWGLVALWSPPGEALPHELLTVEPLTLDHPAVVDAAATLSKPVV